MTSQLPTDDQDADALERSGEWGDPVARPPVKSPRAIVSVAFTRAELARVEQAAAAQGMKTSEYIRHAALSSDAAPRSPVAIVSGIATTMAVIRGPGPKVTISSRPKAFTITN